jgi:heptosyltransferase-2
MSDRQSVKGKTIAATSTLDSYAKPRRAMTGRYRVRHPLLVASLLLQDLLGALHPKRKGILDTDRPMRVLVACWGQLGDVVTILPLLNYLAAQPRVAAIGLLTSSRAKPIVSGLDIIERVHTLDHFFLDRGNSSRVAKIRTYLAGQGPVVEDVRAANYDVSIDLYPFFPTTHRLLWKSRIPVRIGFESSGLGPYLTHPYRWTGDDGYVLDKQLALLGPIFGDRTPTALPAIYPGFRPSDLSGYGLDPGKPYILFHMFSGETHSKKWVLDKWIALCEALNKRGWHVVLSGTKGAETESANYVAQRTRAQSVAGMLSWGEFVTLVSGAHALISVDTVAAHLAACFQRPSVVLRDSRDLGLLFRPNNPHVRMLVHPVACAPCYRSEGCEAMACIRQIEVEDVLGAVDELLGRQQSAVSAPVS